jgi:type IV pilus modification protein PilV
MMRSKALRTIDNNGFTLLESLIAMVILSIGILSLYSMQITSIQQNARASNITIASSWGAEKIEEIVNIPYKDLLDRDGDGTNQDSDHNGKDEKDGGNFGLDDITTTSRPDGRQDSPGGNYTIFWNVAVDHPITGSKTIRVHVVDNNKKMKNVLSLQYIKQAPI